MASYAWIVLTMSAAIGMIASGCDGGATNADAGGDSAGLRCTAADDPDFDTISSMDERAADPTDRDGDGKLPAEDSDSDGDGLSDRDEAGDAECATAPIDTDRDGTPDFLDLDANGDGTPDAMQRTGDRDGDGIPDVRDADVDGDGIDNTIEQGGSTTPRDTDMDGTPDVFDDDSDGDTIRDRDEGGGDPDDDDLPSSRDLDSDGDGISDAMEAGDTDLATPPVECAAEIDVLTGAVMLDRSADFIDPDSDGDGLTDAQEIEAGTGLCDADSDDDGDIDVIERAYDTATCATTTETCGCARSATCRIPGSFFRVVLPYGADPQARDLDFQTAIRVADIFFLTDTTVSMGGTLAKIQTLVTAPTTGVMARVAEAAIPDVWLGGGQFEDLPFGGWGEPVGIDRRPDSPLRVAAVMTPRDRTADVEAAFRTMRLNGGGDVAESSTEALYQLITNRGFSVRDIPAPPAPPDSGVIIEPTDAGVSDDGGDADVADTGVDTGLPDAGVASSRYCMPPPNPEPCAPGRWGAACFRPNALPIVLHFADTCSHHMPPIPDDLPGRDTVRGYESLICAPYGLSADPSPLCGAAAQAPAEWTMLRAGLNARGVKYIGINASGYRCRGAADVTGGSPGTPCRFMDATTRATRTVDIAGAPLIYDLQNAASNEIFTNTIVDAIETLATEVPFDVDAVSRDDPSDPEGVDATRFIQTIAPACRATPATEPCFTAPAVLPPGATTAVGAVTDEAFERVVPGTQVKFRVVFGNDFYRNMQTLSFVAYIDVRADRATVLDTRAVFIVVPAYLGDFG